MRNECKRNYIFQVIVSLKRFVMKKTLYVIYTAEFGYNEFNNTTNQIIYSLKKDLNSDYWCNYDTISLGYIRRSKNIHNLVIKDQLNLGRFFNNGENILGFVSLVN